MKKFLVVIVWCLPFPCHSLGIAPPKTLINILINKCINDPRSDFANREIKEGSLKYDKKGEDFYNRNDKFFSEADKANGITYRYVYVVNYVFKPLDNSEWPLKDSERGVGENATRRWIDGSDKFYTEIENGVLHFHKYGLHCTYDYNLMDKNSEIIDIEELEEKKKTDAAIAVRKAAENARKSALMAANPDREAVLVSHKSFFDSRIRVILGENWENYIDASVLSNCKIGCEAVGTVTKGANETGALVRVNLGSGRYSYIWMRGETSWMVNELDNPDGFNTALRLAQNDQEYGIPNLDEQARLSVEVLPNNAGRSANIGHVKIIKSTGNTAFDQMALTQARRLLFIRPAFRDGRAVASWVELPIYFEQPNMLPH